MPSLLHEAILVLFRNRPALAPELLREALHITLPKYTEARLDSAELTDIQPAEYRADMVILLQDESPVLGIVLEMQLSKDEDKRYVWPVYVANLRARIRCPVCLLVIALEEKVARWARNIIDLGGGNHFVPRVLSLSGVPEVTDDQQAREDPELAVLSAIAHARDPDMNKSIRIALLAKIASIGLDADRSKLYCDLVLNYLPEIAQRAIETMDSRTEALKKALEYDIYIAGMAGVLLVQLAGRFGDLAPEIEESLRGSSVEQLLAISDRLSSAQTLDDALASGVGARRGESLFSQLAGYRAERASR